MSQIDLVKCQKRPSKVSSALFAKAGYVKRDLVKCPIDLVKCQIDLVKCQKRPSKVSKKRDLLKRKRSVKRTVCTCLSPRCTCDSRNKKAKNIEQSKAALFARCKSSFCVKKKRKRGENLEKSEPALLAEVRVLLVAVPNEVSFRLDAVRKVHLCLVV